MTFFARFFEGARPLVDADAFARFYESTHLNVYRYMMALCGVESEAEDITAETFMRAWKNRQHFSGDNPEAALGWLLTIAKRIWIDHHRSTLARPIETDWNDDVPVDNLDAETIFLAQEQTTQVFEALRQLPERPREIIVLRYILGWRVNRIAEHIGIPENSVSVMMRRGLKRMQDSFALQGGSNGK